MASLVLPSASGQGSSGFGLAITVTNAFAQLVTPGFYTVTHGPAGHRRVHRACWYGIGFSGGGSGPDYITWGRFMEYEADYLDVAPGFLGYGDTFYYDCFDGAVISFEVDY